MTTKINFSQIKGAAVNVLDYGADNTGAVDSGAAFNLALAAGATVIVPAGTYLITTSITGVYANKKLIGDKAVLTTTATANFQMLKFPSTADGNEVSGFRFVSTASTDTVNPTIAIDLDQSDQNDIHDNTFTGFNICIRLLDTVAGAVTNPKRNNIHSNLFLDAYGPTNGGYGVLNVRAVGTIIADNIFSPGTFGRHCIYLSAGSTQCIVTGNYAVGSTLGPMSMNTGLTAGDLITNCVIANNVFNGPDAATANSHCFTGTGKIQHCTIMGNQFEGAGANGFLLQSADANMIPSANIISGNRIASAFNEGLYLIDGFNNIISNNYLEGNGRTAGTLYDMVIVAGNTASANGNLVIGNYFGASAAASSFRSSISLGAGTANNIAQDNSLGPQSTLSQYQIIDNSAALSNFVQATNFGAQILTYAASVTPNPTLGEFIQITLTGNLTIGTVTWPYQGQTMTFLLIQDGTGARTVTWSSVYDASQTWSDTGNTANKISTISFKYIGTKWRQVGAQVVWHTAP